MYRNKGRKKFQLFHLNEFSKCDLKLNYIFSWKSSCRPESDVEILLEKCNSMEKRKSFPLGHIQGMEKLYLTESECSFESLQSIRLIAFIRNSSS